MLVVVQFMRICIAQSVQWLGYELDNRGIGISFLHDVQYSKMAAVVTLLTCLPEMLGSNLGWDFDYRGIFFMVSLTPSRQLWYSASINLWSFASKSFPIHLSPYNSTLYSPVSKSSAICPHMHTVRRSKRRIGTNNAPLWKRNLITCLYFTYNKPTIIVYGQTGI
jgi:hypothetical protein